MGGCRTDKCQENLSRELSIVNNVEGKCHETVEGRDYTTVHYLVPAGTVSWGCVGDQRSTVRTISSTVCGLQEEEQEVKQQVTSVIPALKLIISQSLCKHIFVSKAS
jgi:hypothetical protein